MNRLQVNILDTRCLLQVLLMSARYQMPTRTGMPHAVESGEHAKHLQAMGRLSASCMAALSKAANTGIKTTVLVGFICSPVRAIDLWLRANFLDLTGRRDRSNYYILAHQRASVTPHSPTQYRPSCPCTSVITYYSVGTFL